MAEDPGLYYNQLAAIQAAIDRYLALGYAEGSPEIQRLYSMWPNPADYGLTMYEGELIPTSQVPQPPPMRPTGWWPSPMAGYLDMPQGLRQMYELGRQPWEFAFYQTLESLEGPPGYLKWFESNFSSFLRRYMGTLPKRLKGVIGPGMERIGWWQWLQRQEPELRQEWYGLGPAQRGERPWAYAPRIREVQY